MLPGKHSSNTRRFDSRIIFVVILLIVYGFLFFNIEKPETAETPQSSIGANE
jgi:hypothetical protein